MEIIFTPEILQKFFQNLDRSLVDTKLMAMALLAFVGFLRFDELADLKLKDIGLYDTHFEIFQLKAVKLIIIAMSPLSSLARIFAPGII